MGHTEGATAAARGGGGLFRSSTQPPAPLPALWAHLVAKGQQLPAIQMVTPKAPDFFHSPCPRGTPPCPGAAAWMGGTILELSMTLVRLSGAKSLPFPSGCKRPSGMTQRSAARQPLPLGLPKSLNRAVGQTNQFFLTPARVTTPGAGSCADFSGA